MDVALFDLDGTLTKRDTLFDFLRFCVGNCAFYSNMLLIAPVLAVNYFLRHDEQTAKENLLSFFLKNKPREFLERVAMCYADRLDQLIQNDVWDRLQYLKTSGVRVVIVSASLDLWLAPWCRKHDLELICSRALWNADRFSGRLDGPNCRGDEKVRRIREHFGESVTIVEAWGDSPADFPMLSLAQRAVYRGKPWRPISS